MGIDLIGSRLLSLKRTSIIIDVGTLQYTELTGERSLLQFRDESVPLGPGMLSIKRVLNRFSGAKEKLPHSKLGSSCSQYYNIIGNPE